MVRPSSSLLMMAIAICALSMVALVALEGLRRESSVEGNPAPLSPETAEPTASLEVSPGTGAVVREGRSSIRQEEALPRVTTEQSTVTWGSYLESHWGPKWPDVKVYLEKYAPHKLERLQRGIAREHLPPPLSEIESGLLAAFAKEFESRKEQLSHALHVEPWPLPLTAEFLAEHYHQDVDRFDASCLTRACLEEEALRYDLERARSDFFTLAWMYLEGKIAARAYRPCPLVQYDDSSLWPDGVYPGHDIALAILCKGWIINLELYEGEYPEVHELRLELAKLGKARESRVRRALKQDS